MISILSILLLLGALQGVILSLVLFKTKINQTPNNWLATALLVMSTALLFAYFDASGITKKHVHLIELEAPMSLFFMPMLFLYVQKLTQPRKKIKRMVPFLFIPALFFILIRLPFYFQDEAFKRGYIDRVLNNGDVNVFEYSLLLFTDLHSFIYAFLILLLTLKYRKKIVNIFSDIEKIKLQWLKLLAIALTILAGLSTFITFVYLFNLKAPLYLNYFTGGGAVIMIYTMSFFAIAQPEIANKNLLSNQIEKNKQGISEINYDEFFNKIIIHLENKELYRQPGLTLEEFSRDVKLPPYLISKVINKVGKENFYQLINRYRINSIKKALEDKDNKEKIMAIALDNGYLSKTTFNSVFKQLTKTTPSEYRNRYLASNK